MVKSFNKVRIFLLFSASFVLLSGFSDKPTQMQQAANDQKGNQRAYYECSDPLDIDSTLFIPEQGKTYFHFNTQLAPSGLKDLGFGWTEDNPKDYFAAYLINTSDSTFHARRQDGSLIMIQEALDKKGNWMPIEYWVYSGCGNSYFNPLELEPGKYVLVPVKKYTGKFQTKIRLKFKQDDNVIYSDTFDGAVDPAQFAEETGQVNGILYHGKASYLD